MKWRDERCVKVLFEKYIVCNDDGLEKKSEMSSYEVEFLLQSGLALTECSNHVLENSVETQLGALSSYASISQESSVMLLILQ